jgi:protein O-GlcNAc transferase
MGIFDRFRSTGQAAHNPEGKAGAAEQDAARSIEEGHVLEAEGKLDEAMQQYLNAIRLAPNPARAHLNHGNVLLLRGDLKGALDAFRNAIKHKPDYAGAYYNMGNALLNNGRFDEAVANYRRALNIQPDYAEVHCSLGVALKELRQLDEAVASFRNALGINPDFVEAHINLGLALQELNQLESALASYRRVLEIKPDFVDAHANLGNALLVVGQFENAAACYRQALELRPDFAEAHNNLGLALKELGQIDSAITSYRQALELKPDLAEAHNNMGVVLQNIGQFESALACYRHALEIKPDFMRAHINLGGILRDLGQLNDAEAGYRRALEIRPDYAEAHSDLLFILNYTASRTPSYYLEQARQYGRLVAGKVGSRFFAWHCAARPERLRVGLVSGNFCKHVVGYFLEGLLAHIDAARIELIAYQTHYKEDELTARIRPHFSAWKSLVSVSDADAAKMIHADGVHILLDLSGHTAYNRLPMFARKPAPVQASWLGYFATTGIEEMDYLLADKVGIPEALREQFTESIWYLPDTRLCFTAPMVNIPVTPLPALSNSTITLGCFQDMPKLGDVVLEAWGEIFAALPNAKLRIQCKQLDDPALVEHLLQRLRRCGIDATRVVTHASTQRETYLAAHAEVDMILDTFPYPGGTTTCEALWMGVPTLTLAGDTLLARQGASILSAAGLNEWVATSKEEYIAKAIALASDKSKLATLRAGLRQQVLASPLFDAPRFARNLEDALCGMWQNYQKRHDGKE